MPKMEKAEKETCPQIRKKRISWQLHMEKRLLTNLLRNKKVMEPFLNFLKISKSRKREGVKEKEIE